MESSGTSVATARQIPTMKLYQEAAQKGLVSYGGDRTGQHPYPSMKLSTRK